MRVRLTQSVEPREGVADATGEVIRIDFHPMEPEKQQMMCFSWPWRCRAYGFRGGVEPPAVACLHEAR